MDFVDDVDLVARPARAGTDVLRSSRTSSTPLLLAPSISSTSTSSPVAMPWQMSHWSHGVAVGPFSQLSALARMRAVEVLPTPRAPVNR